MNEHGGKLSPALAGELGYTAPFLDWMKSHESMLWTKTTREFDLDENTILFWDKISAEFQHNHSECADDHGLTKDEKMSLNEYTGWLSKAINAALRSEDANQLSDVSLYTDVLSSALHKIPAQRGVVYRYVNLPDSVLKQYTAGRTIRQDAYLSTSSDPNWVKDGKSFGSILFRIQVFSGHDVHCYSSVPAENEWLLDKGLSLKILQKVSRHGHTVIDAVEVLN